MDLTNKKSEPDGLNPEENETLKKCADCGTSKTPLWRGGPAGPKSLCNACGIRSRKKIRVISSMNSNKARVNSSTKKSSGSGSNNSSSGGSTVTTISSTSSSSNKIRGGSGNSNNSVGSTTLNQRLISFGREVRSTVGKRTPRRMKKLGEDEQAAILLMALSYGSVYA